MKFFWKLSSLPIDFIFEEKTAIDWKIMKLSEDLTKCAYSFGTYFSYAWDQTPTLEAPDLQQEQG